ncbi:MAG: CPBP family intramembrane metalloprotease [Clostridia bacterium]|nr:CPBP family intramembrane metalloprotease [Clostridia bacterium]
MRRALGMVTSYAMLFTASLIIAGFFAPLWMQELVICLGLLSPILLCRFLWREDMDYPAISRLLPKKRSLFLLLPFFMLATRIVGIVASLPYTLLELPLPAPSYPDSMIEALILLAVLPALCEEFFCRYMVLGAMLPYGRRTAVLVSALVFGFFHMNFYQIPYALFSGLILGWITVEGESILPSLLFHFVNNFLAVLFAYVELPSYGQMLYTGLLVLLAVVLTALFVYLNIDNLRFTKINFRRLREILLSPLSIFLAVSLFLSVWSLVVNFLVR